MSWIKQKPSYVRNEHHENNEDIFETLEPLHETLKRIAYLQNPSLNVHSGYGS